MRRGQIECSHRRSGPAKSKRSKGSCSRGSRGEEPRIPKGQVQGEISCWGIAVGMRTCWEEASEQSTSEQDEVHKGRERRNGDDDY